KGTSLGELQISDVMADESVEPGETVITSGGDRIYPKGLAVGIVSTSTPDHDNDPFLMIKVKPATDLHRLEEVLVITKTAAQEPSCASDQSPIRAADILAQRLPSVPKQDPAATKNSGGVTKSGSTAPGGTAVPAPSPATTNSPATKTGNTAGPAKPPVPT